MSRTRRVPAIPQPGWWGGAKQRYRQELGGITRSKQVRMSVLGAWQALAGLVGGWWRLRIAAGANEAWARNVGSQEMVKAEADPTGRPIREHAGAWFRPRSRVGRRSDKPSTSPAVSYTHLRAHETR